MASIEAIKRKAQSAAFAASERAQGAAAVAGEKAVAFKAYVGEKAALVAEKRSLNKSYLALGEWYASQCGEDVPDGAADLIDAIRASQAKIAELTERAAAEEGLDEETLEAIARETAEAAEEAEEE